jgi:hypothetical protein
MRIQAAGLALAFILAAAASGQASTPNTLAGDEVLTSSGPTVTVQSGGEAARTVIARRNRGADDPPGDDHGRNRGGKGGKGGKGRGGHDDGPNHDRNDDHGDHGPNHT